MKTLLILLGIALFSSGCTADVSKNTILTSDQLLSNAFFVLYNGSYVNSSKTFALNDTRSLVCDNRYSPRKQTVLYIHGWEEGLSSPNVQIIPSSYAMRGGWNVILLDYGRISHGNYIRVTYNAIQLSKLLGPILSEAFSRRIFNIRKFHVVGHSLGAHVASNIGQGVIASGQRLRRITGLDPAGPLFYFLYSLFGASRLSGKDAAFVDVINTDSYVYGIPFKSGKADFYPNGGFRWQPGCPQNTVPGNLSDINDFCSHQKSVQYYAQSVSLSGGGSPFYAAPAPSWGDFRKHINVTYIDAVKMGIDCPMYARGKFYLQTADYPGMSLGANGVYFQDPYYN